MRLIGIGVGPGDPELITVKAVNALRACDVILVPATEASGSGAGRAEKIIVAACPEIAERITRVPFSMADRTGVTKRRSEAWQTSATAAIEAFEAGAQQVGFATIGDPSIYSTFSYLAGTVRDHIADLEVEVVPGIMAMQALAASSLTPLVEGDETLALVPLKHGTEQLAEISKVVDTCVIYKAGRHIRELAELVGDDPAVAGTNVGLPDEEITPLSEVDEAPYFTSVIWPPRRGGTGERI